MTLLAIALVIVLLILLVALAKAPPLVAFVVAALLGGVLLGVPLETIPKAIEKGIGDTIGPLVVIVVLGAMAGKLIADSGAARRIADALIALFGPRRLPLAMAATGFLVGIPLFYNVGFVLMVPLIFSITARAKLPPVHVGMPLLAGLSIAHGFLPPHPSPTALVTQLHADLGQTLIYGLIVGVPTLLIAGPLFAMTLKNIQSPPSALFGSDDSVERRLPGTAVSFLCALLPVGLIAGTTALGYLALSPDLAAAVRFVGNPTVVLLVAIAIAMVALGAGSGLPLPRMMESFAGATRDIAPILLIIAGAGALKQVLVESGADRVLAAELATLPIPPLVLGWLLACVIRIALGSATVAGLTAGGLVAPLLATSGANPNLMVLAIGAGSLMCSHVNDSGFWMFKEYFGLSLRDTFRSWSLMETLVGSFGLVFVLLLDALV
ncbi:gluconate:H+ symporter [Sphingomonas sp. BK069]|uniref:gluconate:H+ symporter n=1 Tax=Sphingomonas sp. BK069 TaxID=2586979 RepID=UPI00160BE0CB|nr:gluconate:H+ symporter [Sphingomonas sp. BK069]MBB3347952.1 Gnt-I system high-affinity gluconate transporter [Sphingomonas sp. BK069]